MHLNLTALRASLANAAPPTDPADHAQHEFEEHHYAKAFEEFAALADQGDAHGARMALLMAEHGLRLCGRHFPLDPARHERWRATATADTSPAE